MPSAVEAWSLHHWTTREVPGVFMISEPVSFSYLTKCRLFSWERISQSGLMIQTQSGLGDGLGAVVVLAEMVSPGEVLQLQ